MPKMCPAVCGENEEFKECGTACPPTCTNHTRQRLCPSVCIRGCFCRPGFVKDPHGRCVLPQQCPAVCRENEEFRQCGSACPITCDSISRPTVPCPLPCSSGCFCKPGFVKGPNGRCILQAFCPVLCGENEEFTECGSACPLTCSNRTQQGLCPQVCVKGCFCRGGFVRDQRGRCVLPQLCPVVCSQNEEFKECGPGCPITCNTLTQANQECSLPCSRGCFCKPGFVRGPGGKCILPGFCPVVCGENEEFSDCGTACPLSCFNNTGQRPCPLPCARGCFCRAGFVRDPEGKCILPQACPVVCRPNEEFKACGPSCQVTCDNLALPPRPCPPRCSRGCFCKPGFVRDRSGNCVLPSLCPVVCGENEVFKECGSACPATCGNPNQPRNCPKICVKDCFCRDGFFRDPNGKCVLPQNCPIACNKNEIFQECGSACPHTCENVGKPTAPCPLPCVRGCFCKPGFVKNKDGNCILPNFCPIVCGENEVFNDCGPACTANCTHPQVQTQNPPVCVKGCFCREGLVRDPQGKCIRPELCPIVCKENEQFNECGSACPLTCDNIGTPNAACTLQCVRGCFCKPGYVRDRNGRCILPNFCPIVCGVNEEFQECGTACPANCTNRLQPSRPCPSICIKGCFCKRGFVRDSTGKCVLPNQCPVVCRANEEFKNCGNPCQITCDNLGIPAPQCPLPCTRGCFCKPGFVRNRDGNCVRPSLCPLICGENQEFQRCGTACPATCDNPSSQRFCPAVCVTGCFCKRGFVRDSSGRCVRPDLCPVVCGENEVFNDCGTACPVNCTNRLQPQLPCPAICIRGCFCRPGFIRGPTGKCILPEQCPLVCGVNEIFQECGPSCPANCTNPNPRPCLPVCNRGCFCAPGFIRDSAGRCIRPEQCRPVCGENEGFLRCGSACAPNCTNPRGVANCPLPCIRGCFCKFGFVRDPSGRCVLPRQCPGACGENEGFLKCGSACAPTCTNPRGFPNCSLPCIKGCFCKFGFVRDPSGRCVLPRQCPGACGENEGFSRCGSACPPTCTNPRGFPNCPLPCIKGCFCKFGFVRDPSGKCVLPGQCPVACGLNEEFKQCGTSCPANCTNLQPRGPCTQTCVSGCFCRPGFVRNSAGRCVRPDQCPRVCGENEGFLRCGSACAPNCSNPRGLVPCPLPCISGCFCKFGFVRDPSGRCVLPQDCPIVCSPNEVFQDCGTACPTNCSNPVPPRSCPDICVRGCFCRPGFIRNSRGVCVRPELCPVETVCGENEVFNECGTACPTTCENPVPQPSCPPICRRGCFCRPGFVRDPSRKCVRPERCPRPCGPLEVFNDCGPACPANCTHPNPPGPNTTAGVCVRGCFCREGLLRSPNGDCVLPQFCPSVCTKPNEVFLECGPECIQTCSRIDPRRNCYSRCVKGCFCAAGFVRDIGGNCIRPSECPIEPQQCPPREAFYACKPTCGYTCDTLDPESIRTCTEVCQPGCFCVRGLVRTRDGRCVTRDQCPRPIVPRRLYQDETESPTPWEVTPTVMSTNPVTLGTTMPPETTATTPTVALTTQPTETIAITTKPTTITSKKTAATTEKTAITTETTRVSTIQSTTPTDSYAITSKPTKKPTETSKSISYTFLTTPLTTAIPTTAAETKTVTARTTSMAATSTTGTPAPVSTTPVYVTV